MKKVKFTSIKIKYICIIAMLIIAFLSNDFVYSAQEFEFKTLYTEEFLTWKNLSEDEKEKTLLPKTYTTVVSEQYLKDYNEKSVNVKERILSKNFTKSIDTINGATFSSERYNLNEDISVEVKNQMMTNQCWAFSIISALETNVELNRDIQKRFSIRHMDYATSKTFIDGINHLGYEREVGDGGLAPIGLSYLTNGQGAVLESDMPFENNEDKISLKELDKKVDTIVTSYTSLPAIYKRYAVDNGEVVYTNGGTAENLVIYTDEEVEQMRNIIKDHIIKYGAISAVTAGSEAKFYNNPDIAKATAYFCNDNTIVRDHGVTIVGWDDTYSKDNFTGAAKPYSDGAYIVLNSYGTDVFDKGYLYISYEDALIEADLYGIKSTSDVDYDNLYQYNPFGENLLLGMDSVNEGYLFNTYDRDISKKEVLKYVGVSIPENVSLEIYIDPEGDNVLIDKLLKVAETEILEPGYHRIPIKEIELTGNQFSIVIKQKSTENHFYFLVETAIPDSIYENVTGNPGSGGYSIDGYSWNDISIIEIDGLDMKTSDICIKAFTENIEEEKEPEITISSSVYEIKDADIYGIAHSTTIEEFKKHILISNSDFEIYDKNDLAKDEDFIKTGMILKLSNDKEYKLIVEGDTNCSGTISLIDFSKLIAHYSEMKGCELKGDALKAADLNYDGRISQIDISKMIVLYTSI